MYVTYAKDTSCTIAAIRATCTTPGGHVVCLGTNCAPIHDILEVVFWKISSLFWWTYCKNPDEARVLFLSQENFLFGIFLVIHIHFSNLLDLIFPERM